MLLLHGLPKCVARTSDLHALATRLGVRLHGLETRFEPIDLLLKHRNLFLFIYKRISFSTIADTQQKQDRPVV